MPNPESQRFSPLLSSKSFTGLALTFRSLIHFELIFVCSVGSFTCGDYFPTSRISFSCFTRLLHTLASTLVFSNQNQKSETESTPKDQCQWETGNADEPPSPISCRLWVLLLPFASLLLFQVIKLLFSTICWKDNSFPIKLSWHPCPKSIEHRFIDLFLSFHFYSFDLQIYTYVRTTMFWCLEWRLLCDLLP